MFATLAPTPTVLTSPSRVPSPAVRAEGAAGAAVKRPRMSMVSPNEPHRLRRSLRLIDSPPCEGTAGQCGLGSG